MIPATADRPPRHKWRGRVFVPAAENADGCDHSERVCERCDLTKITVKPPQGYPWKVWRMPNGQTWQGDATPPCVVAQAAENLS
jgi:hypothetical protein